MNIIFGKSAADELADRYTVLELDTVRYGRGDTVELYCVVESESDPDTVQLHRQLIQAYREQRWAQCVVLIDKLTGSFGTELDTFYENLGNRVKNLQQLPVTDHWDYVLDR